MDPWKLGRFKESPPYLKNKRHKIRAGFTIKLTLKNAPGSFSYLLHFPKYLEGSSNLDYSVHRTQRWHYFWLPVYAREKLIRSSTFTLLSVKIKMRLKINPRLSSYSHIFTLCLHFTTIISFMHLKLLFFICK